MALALAPLHARFGIEAVIATTLQAVSGAGYPGVPSLDVVDNVLPFIDGEERKMEIETRKILGRLGNNSFENAPFAVSAQCHRVNVADGHMVAVRVKLAKRAAIEEVREALAAYTLGSAGTEIAHRARSIPSSCAMKKTARSRAWTATRAAA